MNRNRKANGLILVCPVCGFSFKPYDEGTRKKIKKCPMCGHEFKDPDLYPRKSDELNKKFF